MALAVGIDPSFNNFAVVLAEITARRISVLKAEVFQIAPNKGLRKGEDDIRKAREIVAGLAPYLNYQAVAEMPTGSLSARAARTAGICLGLLAYFPNLELVTPLQVKSVVKPKATKADMIAWAKVTHPEVNWRDIKPKSKEEHIADAIAVLHFYTNLNRS